MHVFPSSLLLMLGALGFLLPLPLTGCHPQNTSASAEAKSHLFTSLVGELNQVHSSMVPAPIRVTRTLSCTQGADFGACQSRRSLLELQNYPQRLFDLAFEIDNAGLNLGIPMDNSRGTTVNAYWIKTSSTHWSYLMLGVNGAPLLSIVRSGPLTTILWNESVALNPRPRSLALTLIYNGPQSWSMRLFKITTGCDSSNPTLASHAELRLTRIGDLGVGKNMLIMPRWPPPGETLNCASPSGTPVALYMDFVGNAQASKAALYLLPASVSDFSQPQNYELADFCSNYPQFCGSGAKPSTTQVLALQNPWCQTNPTVSPSWNSDCATLSTTVSGSPFSNASDWIPPSSLSQQTIVLPTQL